MRIPLAIRLPQGSGEQGLLAPQLVGLADVLPTILDFLGIARADGLQGRSLLALAHGEPGDGDRRLFFSSRASGTLAMRDGRWKLIYEPRTRAAELYDLEADPHERHDLSETDGKTTQQAIDRLLAWYRAAPRPFRSVEGPRVKLDDETSRQLQALGYIQRAPGPAGSGEN